jgi:hypothetical protein
VFPISFPFMLWKTVLVGLAGEVVDVGVEVLVV